MFLGGAPKRRCKCCGVSRDMVTDAKVAGIVVVVVWRDANRAYMPEVRCNAPCGELGVL
mgnify:CR=1 FL=1|jgi:hypothetical protein